MKLIQMTLMASAHRSCKKVFMGENNVKSTRRLFFIFATFIVLALSLAACGGGSGGGGTSGDTVIDIASIPGVAVPVRGEVPVTTAIDTALYTGSITWSPADHLFAPETVYTAHIALTAKAGFTLTGVPADFFTVAGATTTNAADSGDVTAVFPATGAVPDINVVFVKAVQTGGVSGTADSTALTLSFDVDPTTLTRDDITVTGATKGLLTGIRTTRNLTITNITVANGARLSVTITSPAGYSISGSPKTVTVYRELSVGMDYLGGKIAYILQPGDPGYNANDYHGLIAATEDQSTGIIWAPPTQQFTAVPGGTGTALGTGSSNTDNIIAQNGTGINYAALLARTYNGGGYSDWYLPSIDELNKLYLNKDAIGGFADSGYWSSSEYAIGGIIQPGYALYRAFPLSWYDDYMQKSWTYRVRAVRDF